MKQFFYKSIAPSLLLLFSGCGGSGNTTSSKPVILKAFYVDSAVEGVTYRCGNQKGYTDKDGAFSFEEGKGCDFSIGTVTFKSIAPDLLKNNAIIKEKNTTIAKFLLSFDWDGNAKNGIQIKQEIGALLDEKGIRQIDLDQNRYQELENTLRQNHPDFKSHLYTDREVRYHLEGNHPPVAAATVSPTNIRVNEAIHCDATASSDPDGDTLTYEWLENGQMLSTQASFDLTDLSVGGHTITLKVTDTAGETSERSFNVTVTEAQNQKPVADAGDDVTVRYRQQFTVDASKSKDPDGEIIDYAWRFKGHLLHSGSDLRYTRKATQPTGYYVMDLTVTDDANATDTDHVTVHVTPAHNEDNVTGLIQTSNGDDEYIIDHNTGLMWVSDNRDTGNKGCLIFSRGDTASDEDGTVSDENVLTQLKTKAQEWCANLSYAGYDDWRVSTPQENSVLIKYWDDPSKPGTVSENLRDNGMVLGYTHKGCKQLGGIENDKIQLIYTEHTASPGSITNHIHVPFGMRCVRDIN